MGHQILHAGVWAVAGSQHGVIARWQLIELGYSPEAIKHRALKGRLHPIHTGIYAVGRRELTQEGLWMAAVLACGPEAALSHESAAAHYGIRSRHAGEIHVSVPASVMRSRPGIKVHRRRGLARTTHQGIPVTTVPDTLIDLAAKHGTDYIEGAINEADKLDLADPEAIRQALDESPPRPGLARLKTILDIRTFTMSDSELERRLKPIARAAGLELGEMGRWVNGFKVDFYWPELGLVVETDGLRYHRTPQQQARDRIRDQTHTAAGLTPLRLTRAQVKFDRRYVERTLTKVATRLREAQAA